MGLLLGRLNRINIIFTKNKKFQKKKPLKCDFPKHFEDLKHEDFAKKQESLLRVTSLPRSQFDRTQGESFYF